MPKLLISSCLLGHKVRYDGKDNLQTHSGGFVKPVRGESCCRGLFELPMAA